MDETIESVEIPDADNGFAITTDVLAALRSQESSSAKRFGNIEESLESMEKEISKKFGVFVGETAECKLVETSLFNLEYSSATLTETPSLARIDGDEDQLLLCVGMAPATFRNLLAKTLGGKQIIEDGQTELTFAERKIFARFIDQLMSGYFEILDSISDIGIPRKPYLIDNKGLQAICTRTELISIVFEVKFEEEMLSFLVMAPLAVLEPTESIRPNEEEVERTLQAEQAWTKCLLNNVEHMEIPLSVQAASLDMPLSTISNLSVGQNLNLTLNPNGVKLLDSEGKITFLADIVFQRDNIQLRVAPPDETRGG